MSGKAKFWTSIIAGACIGGAISLFNSDARNYGKSLVKETNDCLNECIRNPEDSVKKVKNSISTFSNFISENTDSALNAINQIEQTVNRLTK